MEFVDLFLYKRLCFLDVVLKVLLIYCRSFLSLCVGYIGEYLEDLIDDIDDIVFVFFFYVKVCVGL